MGTGDRFPHQVPSHEQEETTIIIIGKSGSGKSVLGNKLLYADLAPDDDLEDFFEERGGAAGVTDKTKSCVSRDGTLRVIDTPGIPDPDKSKTLYYFDAIVETIRQSSNINLLIFLVNEDRTNEEQFDKYRALLKQFGTIPCNKLMICRQPAYCRIPREKDKLAKQKSGKEFVDDILSRSCIGEIPFKLILDGIGNEADKALQEILEIARMSPPMISSDYPTIRTFQERVEFVNTMTSTSSRKNALEERKKLLESNLRYHERWLKWHRYIRAGTAITISSTIGQTGGIHTFWNKHMPKPLINMTKASMKKLKGELNEVTAELDSEISNIERLEKDKEELEELKILAN